MSALITTKFATHSPATETGFATEEGRREAGTLATVKAVGLFAAAPFIGLLYVVLLPFVGLGVLAWIAGKALAAHSGAVLAGLKSLATLVAAPFIGLAFVLLLPLIGLVMMATVTVRTMSVAAQAH